MSITVKCGGCGASFNARDELMGKRVKCPKCQASIDIPAAPPPIAPGSPDAPYPTSLPPAGSQQPPAIGNPPPRICKTFYVASFVVFLMAVFVLRSAEAVIIGMNAHPRSSMEVAKGIGVFPGQVVIYLISLPLTLYASVVVMILIYRMWAAIHDARSPISPGKALGLSFVPLFNLYWLARMLWTWPGAYGEFASRHGLSLRPAREGLFVAYIVTNLAGMCCGLTEFTRLLAAILSDSGFRPWFAPSVFIISDTVSTALVFAAAILFVFVIAEVCDRINALPPLKDLAVNP